MIDLKKPEMKKTDFMIVLLYFIIIIIIILNYFTIYCPVQVQHHGTQLGGRRVLQVLHFTGSGPGRGSDHLRGRQQVRQGPEALHSLH